MKGEKMSNLDKYTTITELKELTFAQRNALRRMRYSIQIIEDFIVTDDDVRQIELEEELAARDDNAFNKWWRPEYGSPTYEELWMELNSYT